MQLAKATVLYPCKDEPYEGDYGPSWSVGLTPDDPSLPRVGDNGILNVWKKDGSTQARYMRTLKKDDRVDILWTEPAGGRSGYWSFILPSEQPAATSPTVRSAVAQEPASKVWLPLSTTEIEVMRVMIEDEAKLLLDAFDYVRAQAGEEISDETVQKIATSAYIQARREFKRGLALPESQSASLDKVGYTESVKQFVENGDTFIEAVLKNIAIYASGYGDTADVIEMFKKVGFRSEFIDQDDEETWQLALQVADEYASVKDEAGEGTALDYVGHLFRHLVEEDDSPPF